MSSSTFFRDLPTPSTTAPTVMIDEIMSDIYEGDLYHTSSVCLQLTSRNTQSLYSGQ